MHCRTRVRQSHCAVRRAVAAVAVAFGLAQALYAGGRPAVERRLDYSVRVWKGLRFLGRTVGTVVVEFGQGKRGEQRSRLVRVHTKAGLLGMRVDATTESHLHARTGRELGFHYLRTGSRRVESRLDFLPGRVEYLKFERRDGAKRPTWQKLAVHASNGDVFDMFATFYVGRVRGLAVGGPPRRIRCVADRKLWDVSFRAVARERVTVPAGTFDTVRLAIKATPANAYTKSLSFRGPFALGEDAIFWVEPASGTLVKLSGTAHLAIRVRTEMRLVRVTTHAVK